MAGLSAGDLDREVTIQTAPYVTSDTGEKTLDWDNATEETGVPVQWIPGASREGYESQHRLESHVDGVFRMYERDPAPTPDDTRIIFEGKTYDIRPPVEAMQFDDAIDVGVVARGE